MYEKESTQWIIRKNSVHYTLSSTRSDINIIFSEKWTADIMELGYACISTSQKRIAVKLKALK